MGPASLCDAAKSRAASTMYQTTGARWLHGPSTARRRREQQCGKHDVPGDGDATNCRGPMVTDQGERRPREDLVDPDMGDDRDFHAMEGSPQRDTDAEDRH